MTRLVVLWLSALVSAALGAWVLFDGAWGVNTVVWATVAMIGLIYGTWKARLPAPLVAYTVAILALMLIPSTVTAVYGAFGAIP